MDIKDLFASKWTNLQLNGHKMDTKWTQNGHKMDTKWSQNGQIYKKI